MSGIVGGINLRSSGLVNNSSATDGQVLTGTGAGLPAGFEAAAGGDTLLQKKWYYFNEGANMVAAGAWADCIHPIGDGTLALTPATSGNIFEIQFFFYLGHNSNVHAALTRMQMSTDDGSSYAVGYGLGNDQGFGTFQNYTTSLTSAAMGGTLWAVADGTDVHKFKFQSFGWASAGAFKVNYAEANLGGGTAYSTVVISEYDATASAITAGGAL